VDGDFVILGGAGNDDITAGQGDDQISAGDGDDSVRMSTYLTPEDVIDGGDGYDTLYFTGSTVTNQLENVTNFEELVLGNMASSGSVQIVTSDTLVAAGATLVVNATALQSDRTLIFSGGHESDGYFEITGGAGNDTIQGGSLDDIIIGGLGDDILIGDDGNDTLTGGAGNDTFEVTAGNDVITDLETGDILKVSSDGNATANDIAGFVATNSTSNTSTGVVILNATTGGVTINMDQAVGSRGYTINGNTGNDILTGSDWADIINGGEGDDWIDGGLGNDLINAGAGNDTVVYSNTNTTVNGVDGGDGIDTIDASASGTGVSIDLSSTTDAYINFENIIGSDFNDALLRGDAGNNIIAGGAGDDDLDGGAGNDRLIGGTGKDDLWGGLGADTFVFAAGDSGQSVATADVIYDFNAGAGDLIELFGVATVADYAAANGSANNEVTFLANAANHFSGAGDVDVYVEYDANSSGDAWMAVDMDGDGAVGNGDLFIVLIGVDTNTELGLNGSFITTSGVI
jgi:Ca2+-binding RTX toxin-like protein